MCWLANFCMIRPASWPKTNQQYMPVKLRYNVMVFEKAPRWYGNMVKWNKGMFSLFIKCNGGPVFLPSVFLLHHLFCCTSNPCRNPFVHCARIHGYKKKRLTWLKVKNMSRNFNSRKLWLDYKHGLALHTKISVPSTIRFL